MHCTRIERCLLIEALWLNSLTFLSLRVRKQCTRLLGLNGQERGVA
jgi:hypothetical protein